jgi:amino-acid N-acetyltransferase
VGVAGRCRRRRGDTIAWGASEIVTDPDATVMRTRGKVLIIIGRMTPSAAQVEIPTSDSAPSADLRADPASDDREIASHPEADDLLDGELGDALYRAQFVAWFRAVAPYVHAFKRKIFVVGVSGEAIAAGRTSRICEDLALLRALGIRIVVIHGSRPQIEEQLRIRQVASQFHNDVRITDRAALECAKEANGEIRLDIEAAFSQGLANTPMANADIKVLSGNFITARPLGVIDGVDFQHTGLVRKVSAEVIQLALNARAVVLMSPLGFSPTGEAFNLDMEDLASSVAAALHAEKLIFVTEGRGLFDADGELIRELSEAAAKKLLDSGTLAEPMAYYLKHALRAIKDGVPRAHFVPFSLDGAALLEIFTHDGVGTMIADDDLEELREATIDDVGGILKLIEPLEADGTLVKRGRTRIEREIDNFSVIDHDGRIFGCAALYPFPTEKMAELACLTVDPEAQGMGDGEKLMKHIEQRARAVGVDRLFVLTTRTAHWFLKRGFTHASVDVLPKDRQRMYNWSRKSQILVKKIDR